MFNITIIDDDLFEISSEVFQIGLRFVGTAPPRVTLDPVQANITILDNDLDGEHLN